MKFLVLALCVCAAAAAPQGFKPFQQSAVLAKAAAQTVAQPFVQAAKAVSSVASGNDAEAAVLRFDSNVEPDKYTYTYETANGISAQASGSLKKVENVDVLVSQGSYKYTAADGTPVEFSYVADENGYQPQSDLLPVGPPVPEAIARSLAYIAAHPAPAEPATNKRF